MTLLTALLRTLAQDKLEVEARRSRWPPASSYVCRAGGRSSAPAFRSACPAMRRRGESWWTCSSVS